MRLTAVAKQSRDAVQSSTDQLPRFVRRNARRDISIISGRFMLGIVDKRQSTRSGPIDDEGLKRKRTASLAHPDKPEGRRIAPA